MAIFCDVQLEEMTGRDLLAGIRTDFGLRETPFLMIDGEQLGSRLEQVGPSAVEPVLAGFDAALAPRVAAREQVRAGAELRGSLEQVGLGHLLRLLGRQGVAGHLYLRKGEERNAEVLISGGEIFGVTVNAPQATVGPMAMLHLLAYAWQDYLFQPAAIREDRVSLGDVDHLVASACQHNNLLVARLYQLGMQIPDVSVDRSALDLYLQGLAPDTLEPLIRLVEGEAAVQLAAADVAPAGLLKSMLFELRRAAVIRVESMRSFRSENGTAERSALGLAAPAPRSRRRWPVAVAAGLGTVLLAAAGYLVYWHLLAR
jgi:CheY-like chemotaxis protein